MAKTVKAAEQLQDIRELMESEKTPKEVFDGVCALQNWRNGKQVTVSEYQKAVKDFAGTGGGRYA